MLFHTPQFLFLFLPAALVGYFALARLSVSAAYFWLAGASLFFYGYWDPGYVPLILVSISVNYTLGRAIGRANESGRTSSAGLLMWLGVVLNTGALLYYKYTAFAVSQIAAVFGADLQIPSIELPIGISFYTFTQIAYLVDVRRRVASERNFVSYTLFVSYFPHLVAGPLLHHKEMMPQFSNPANTRPSLDNIARGITLLAMGLFKKVVIADGLAPTANAFFDAPIDASVSAGTAWMAAMCYTLQLYFDFSGYSDMAIGLSLLFNVKLPVNFNSPYQATSIIEFWRRWHMTLSRFLRDYVYIGMGGGRRGAVRRFVNLFLTMLIGGLWHGANWTFVVWGGLHGIFLIVNHGWRWIVSQGGDGLRRIVASRTVVWAGSLLTFGCVVLAWVVFRAPSIEFASHAIARMLTFDRLLHLDVSWRFAAWVGVLLAWVAFAPNTCRLVDYWFGVDGPDKAGTRKLVWRPTAGWAGLVALLLVTTAVVAVTQRDKLEFLYFQF